MNAVASKAIVPFWVPGVRILSPPPCCFALRDVDRDRASQELATTKWGVERDGSRTPQTQSVQLLVTLHKKRSMGMLISLGQPINTSLPYNNKGILSKKLVNAR